MIFGLELTLGYHKTVTVNYLQLMSNIFPTIYF